MTTKPFTADSPWQQGFGHGRAGDDLPPAPAHWSDRARTMYENGHREGRARASVNNPIPGQPAAIVMAGPQGPFLARFPYEVGGGREKCFAHAEAWRDENHPGAQVRGYTGEVNLIWEDDAKTLADELRALMARGLTSGEARNIFAEADQEPYADYIAQARETYATDEIEIDDTPEVSEGEGGCWVGAWVWVAGDTDEDDDDLAEAADGDTCSACGRDSINCSRHPCADVMADREDGQA